MYAEIKTPVDQSDLPVSLQDVKDHLKITKNDEDQLLVSYLLSATAEAEAQLNQKLSPQVWKLYFDSTEDLTSVSLAGFTPVREVRALNAAGNVIVGYVATYTRTQPERLSLSGALPLATDYIEVTCGYEDPEFIPGPIKQWIKMRVGEYSENREAAQERGLIPVEYLDKLLWPYRFVRF